MGAAGTRERSGRKKGARRGAKPRVGTGPGCGTDRAGTRSGSRGASWGGQCETRPGERRKCRPEMKRREEAGGRIAEAGKGQIRDSFSEGFRSGKPCGEYGSYRSGGADAPGRWLEEPKKHGWFLRQVFEAGVSNPRGRALWARDSTRGNICKHGVCADKWPRRTVGGASVRQGGGLRCTVGGKGAPEGVPQWVVGLFAACAIKNL